MPDGAVVKFDEGVVHRLDWLHRHAEEFQRLLYFYKTQHPVCLCSGKPGIPMYIAKKSTYYLAKMPGSGYLHAPGCAFYCPQDFQFETQTYQAYVNKSRADAILRVRMSVSSASIHTDDASFIRYYDQSNLSLSGLLMMLFEFAGLNRWYPNMAGKRNYSVFYRYLGAAANLIQIGKYLLSQKLYIPTPDSVQPFEGLTTKRMLIVGLVESIFRSRYGYGIRLMNTPDSFVFWVNSEVIEKFFSMISFAGESWHRKSNTGFLAVMFNAEKNTQGNIRVIDLAGVRLSQQYIPYHDSTDLVALKALIDEKRRFVKVLSCEKHQTYIYPNYLLLDVGNEPRPLYLFGKGIVHRDGIMRSRVDHANDWLWDVKDSEIPDFPRIIGR